VLKQKKETKQKHGKNIYCWIANVTAYLHLRNIVASQVDIHSSSPTITTQGKLCTHVHFASSLILCWQIAVMLCSQLVKPGIAYPAFD